MFRAEREIQKIVKMVLDKIGSKFNIQTILNRLRRIETDFRTIRGQVSRLNSKLNKLEENSHPPRDFVVCENCKCKIKEKKYAEIREDE